jgi:hypothetical protein
MQQQELIERPNNEERERVAIEPVEQSPRRRAREIPPLAAVVRKP